MLHEDMVVQLIFKTYWQTNVHLKIRRKSPGEKKLYDQILGEIVLGEIVAVEKISFLCVVHIILTCHFTPQISLDSIDLESFVRF